MKSSYFSSIFLALLLTACTAKSNSEATFSNREATMFFKNTPPEKHLICRELGGVIQRRGVPLANATIIRTLQWNGNEEGVVDTFTTDNEGRFAIPAHYEDLSISPLSQFVGKTLLEVDYQGEKWDLWYESQTRRAPAELVGTQNMICEFGVKRERVNVDSGLLSTTCKWPNMPKEEEDPYAL
jgi:hypothetical protein